MRPERLLPACLALLCACPGEPEVTPPTPEPPAQTARGNLRFKGPERLNADLAAALELPQEGVCTELGLYQCTALVHNVALGGVDPYGTGLYEASGVTGVTTPIVVERVVWSACGRRVDADLARPGDAVVFRGVQLAGARLASPEGAEVRAAIAQLTQRALQRDPTEEEVARYLRLAREIEQSGDATPARSFLAAACFAAFSSEEAVFY